ncbi:MAG: redoxin domain-containing protein [Lewinellaceae bacterium]|nr:redoxin domain-containing protein [Saprospiraceae bacterium]MCB9312361.1 redoxin domain-containing protein [Lewinellaceae bacterium]HRW74794.1 thioredoxin-like domain-containing protein [Saprospiraceae bacterium]
MTRLITLLFCCFSFWWVSCQNASTSSSGSSLETPTGVRSIEPATPDARIEITVEGLEPGGTAKMIGIAGDQNYIADTCIVDANSTMVFDKDEPFPAGFYYVILPDYSNLQMIVDANQRFQLKTVKNNLVPAMQVINSKENELYYSNLREQGPIDNAIKSTTQEQRSKPKDGPEYNALQVKIDSLVSVRKALLQSYADNYADALFTKFKLSGQNPDLQYPTKEDGSIDIPRQTYLYKSQLWDNVDFSDPRLLRTPIIINKLNRYIKELTPQRPDSIIAATDILLAKVANDKEYFKFFANFIPLFYRPGESTIMDAEAIQVHMVKNYFTPDKAFWSDSSELNALARQASEMEASLIGKKGPDVQAKDLNGQMKSIYEMKAPYIIVYMWNPECSHCKEETPQLVQYIRNNKEVEVFGIAVNTTESEFKRYAKEMGMTWTNVFDPTNKAIYAKYYVDNTPEVYVLNPDRILIGKNLKVNQIQTIIDRDKIRNQD